MKSKSIWKAEILGGLTTFFTMAYIVIVNPLILSTEGTGLTLSGVLTATVLVCFLCTLLMGVFAKLPFAVAPGMGINAFFTFTLILGKQIPWQTALGMVFWSGVLFLLLSLTPMRERIATAIPKSLRIGIAAGIGIFLAFIGFKNAGVVVSDSVTFVKAGSFTLEVFLFFFALVFMGYFWHRKNPAAFLMGIVVVTVIGFFFGKVKPPETIFQMPDFQSVFFQLDYLGALKFSLLPAILSLFFTDLFDSISTFVGVSHATGLVDSKGEPKNLKRGLIVDAIGTLVAGLFGSSSGTAYIESAAGIEAGGRTGKTAIVTALCFLPCFFIAPLVGMVPAFATAPVLVMVGFLLLQSLKDLPVGKIEESLPVFLTLLLIPLTFSITQGILWGFIAHVLLFMVVGRRKDLNPWTIGIGVLSVFLLGLEHFWS